MNTLVRNCIVAFLLNLSLFAVAQAGWICYMHDARGIRFGAGSYSRATAASKVMGYCASNSRYAHNCVLEFCHYK